LYRLKEDPGERRNLASPGSEEASALRKSLERYLSEARTVATEKRTLSSEELRNLQSLGYIAGTAGGNSPPGRGKDPKDTMAVLDLLMDADLLVDQKKIPEAAAKFEAVLKLDPNNGFAAQSLGKCIEDENPTRALSLYKAAIKINPSDSQPYCKAAALLISMDRAGEADSLVRLGLGECNDTTGELHVLWAWTTYLRGGSAAEVSKHLEEAKSLAPELPRAFMLSALLAMKARDREKAIRCLQEMAAVTPPETVLEMEAVPWFKALMDDPRVQAVFREAKAQVH
jgi:tetratricopeptide (TPR) repeat protein